MARTLTQAAIAAKEIRAQLKKAGIVPVSVRSDNFSMGDSVDVFLLDATPAQVVKAHKICDPFQYGHFDGMTDCYEYSNERKDLPAQVKFVHLHLQLSLTLDARIYQFIRGYFEGGDKLPETYSASDRICDDWVSTIIWRQYCQANSAFWAHNS